MYQWDYIPKTEKETGYEDLIDKWDIGQAEFVRLSVSEKDAVVGAMVTDIRTRNHFPIYYFNAAGIADEIQKCRKKNDVHIKDGQLVTSASTGNLLLDFLFPCLHESKASNSDYSVLDRFYSDEHLAACLKRYCEAYNLQNMRTAFFMGARFFWPTAGNFNPIKAKAIWEYIAPKGGIIYDYAAGFGGRMLGALTSKLPYHYICCEPATDTVKCLEKLGQEIEKVTGRSGSYEIHQACSEDLELKPNSVDACFSCPPYFDLERYNDEPTQSIAKFPAYNMWLEGYVRSTIRNCKNALKTGGKFAVVLNDVRNQNRTYYLSRDWQRIAEEEGLEFVEAIEVLSRQTKRKTVLDRAKEHVYIFIKK